MAGVGHRSCSGLVLSTGSTLHSVDHADGFPDLLKFESSTPDICTGHNYWRRRMRPWMKILPRPVRHVLICRLRNRYESFCIGHRGVFDRNEVLRFGATAGR